MKGARKDPQQGPKLPVTIEESLVLLTTAHPKLVRERYRLRGRYHCHHIHLRERDPRQRDFSRESGKFSDGASLATAAAGFLKGLRHSSPGYEWLLPLQDARTDLEPGLPEPVVFRRVKSPRIIRVQWASSSKAPLGLERLSLEGGGNRFQTCPWDSITFIPRKAGHRTLV